MKINMLELPCITYDTYEEEITGKHRKDCQLIEICRRVDRSRIESYSEAIPLHDFREDNKIWTSVVMESGDEFIVNMPLAEFEKLVSMK
jgi:hypothetical protein